MGVFKLFLIFLKVGFEILKVLSELAEKVKSYTEIVKKCELSFKS